MTEEAIAGAEAEWLECAAGSLQKGVDWLRDSSDYEMTASAVMAVAQVLARHGRPLKVSDDSVGSGSLSLDHIGRESGQGILGACFALGALFYVGAVRVGASFTFGEGDIVFTYSLHRPEAGGGGESPDAPGAGGGAPSESAEDGTSAATTTKSATITP